MPWGTSNGLRTWNSNCRRLPRKAPTPDFSGSPGRTLANRQSRGRATSGCGSRTTRRRRKSRSGWPGPTTRLHRSPLTSPPAKAASSAYPVPPALRSRRILRLQGDTQDFDNLLYLASESKESATVLYIGRDPSDDPSGHFYYLKRVFEEMPRRTLKVESRSPASSLGIEPGRRCPAHRAVGRNLGRKRRVSPAIRQGRRDRADHCHGSGHGADAFGSGRRPCPARGGLTLPGRRDAVGDRLRPSALRSVRGAAVQ